MPLLATQKNTTSDKPIWYFLLCWTLFNAIQAYTLELHADEAYYWIYSRFLDWGYFDHPPMVALFIRAGDSLMHNELGLRLFTVLTSTASIYILWLILKKYAVDAWSFVLVVPCIFIFHIYGFTTTPDAPLFFFAVLFYFLYQKYIDEDKWTLALLLGLVIACMLYSKYHAVLLILFTLACNIKLLKRPSFWLIVVLAGLLYIPHILWQVNHGYPSVNYHLYERSATGYDLSNIYLYLPGQLLMAGPIIGWFLLYSAFSIRVKDAFIRCLLMNCIGTLLFFFIATFKGESQPHWTLIAFAPLAMLTLIRFKQIGQPKWFYPVAIINLIFIVSLRLCIMLHVPVVTNIGQIKSYYGFKEWARQVKQKAGDAYVIMDNGFQNPAKYDYYTNSLKGFSYDSRYYRRTQFEIWPIEERMQHQRVYYLLDYPAKGYTTDSIKTTAGTWYAEWVDDVRTYQKVKIDPGYRHLKLLAGEKKDIDLTITNPYPYTVNFSDKISKHEVVLGACFFKGDSLLFAQRADPAFNNIVLKPGESFHFIFNLNTPVKKGKYDLIFSIRTTPFDGSKNINIISSAIE
jgi:hypothetical protein